MNIPGELPAKVKRVHLVNFHGSSLPIVKSLSSELLNVKTIADVLIKSSDIREKLVSAARQRKHGAFTNVDARISVAKNGENENAYEVFFEAIDKRRTKFTIRTELETNGLALKVGGRVLNATGIADQVQFELIRGTHAENGFALAYNFPLESEDASPVSVGISRTSFENILPFLTPAAVYRQRETGVFVGHEFNPKLKGVNIPLKYGYRLEHFWRQVQAQQQATPLQFRKMEGDSVKTSLVCCLFFPLFSLSFNFLNLETLYCC